jgi:hypothetical protein
MLYKSQVNIQTGTENPTTFTEVDQLAVPDDIRQLYDISPDLNYVIYLSSYNDVMLWYMETDRRIKLGKHVHAKWY